MHTPEPINAPLSADANIGRLNVRALSNPNTMPIQNPIPIGRSNRAEKKRLISDETCTTGLELSPFTVLVISLPLLGTV